MWYVHSLHFRLFKLIQRLSANLRCKQGSKLCWLCCIKQRYKPMVLVLSWLCCIKQRYRPMFILVVLYQTKIQTYVMLVLVYKDTNLWLSWLCCIKQRYKPMLCIGCAVSNKDTNLCLSWLCCIKQRYKPILSWLCCIKQRYKPMFILVVMYQTKIQTYVYLGCAVSNKDTNLCYVGSGV